MFYILNIKDKITKEIYNKYYDYGIDGDKTDEYFILDNCYDIEIEKDFY